MQTRFTPGAPLLLLFCPACTFPPHVPLSVQPPLPSPFHKRRLRSPLFWAAYPGSRPPSPTWRRHTPSPRLWPCRARTAAIKSRGCRWVEFPQFNTEGIKDSGETADRAPFSLLGRCCSVWHRPFTSAALHSTEYLLFYVWCFLFFVQEISRKPD